MAFSLEVNTGVMPAAFFRAVEETVRDTLRQGLQGWQVLDCKVTMTHARWRSPMSTAADFRNLTPLVLMTALQRAGTVVCEPIQRFHLEVPADTLAPVLQVLARLRAGTDTPCFGEGVCLVDGDVPAAHVHELQQLLPALTRGEGVLECSFADYRPVRGPAPRRERSDLNPLDRREYLLRLQGRVLSTGGAGQE
jgi:ribosomal protection tetracycline resistance protein